MVREFDVDEGWGILDTRDVPGGCFVHFSVIAMDGFRELRAGQRVEFDFETLDFLQDGCPHRALAVRVL